MVQREVDFHWLDDGEPPILDPDSTEEHHRGPFQLPPLQVYSRYAFMWRGECCCGEHFVRLFLLQFHPDRLCELYERQMLIDVGYICW